MNKLHKNKEPVMPVNKKSDSNEYSPSEVKEMLAQRWGEETFSDYQYKTTNKKKLIILNDLIQGCFEVITMNPEDFEHHCYNFFNLQYPVHHVLIRLVERSSTDWFFDEDKENYGSMYRLTDEIQDEFDRYLNEFLPLRSYKPGCKVIISLLFESFITQKLKAIEDEPNKKKYKFRYIYKITFTFKGHKYSYVGQHKTDDLDDGYKGSGSMLKTFKKIAHKDPDCVFEFTRITSCLPEDDLDIYEKRSIMAAVDEPGVICINDKYNRTLRLELVP